MHCCTTYIALQNVKWVLEALRRSSTSKTKPFSQIEQTKRACARYASTKAHLKRIECVLNLDCGKGQVRFNKCLVHGKHGVRDLVDDLAGVLPDLPTASGNVLTDSEQN